MARTATLGLLSMLQKQCGSTTVKRVLLTLFLSQLDLQTLQITVNLSRQLQQQPQIRTNRLKKHTNFCTWPGCVIYVRGEICLFLLACRFQEHLTSNCNSTSQLLRLTKITLQKLHIPHIWLFPPPPPPPPPPSITLVHKLLLENRISKNQKSWYSDKEILSYATSQ